MSINPRVMVDASPGGNAQPAGMGSAIVGSVSTFISVPFGAYIGLSYDGTVAPLVIGFAVFGALAMLVVLFFAKTSK